MPSEVLILWRILCSQYPLIWPFTGHLPLNNGTGRCESGLGFASRNASSAWFCFWDSSDNPFVFAESLSSSLGVGMGLRRGTFSRPSEKAPGRRHGGSFVGPAMGPGRAIASVPKVWSSTNQVVLLSEATSAMVYLGEVGNCSMKSSRSPGMGRSLRWR